MRVTTIKECRGCPLFAEHYVSTKKWGRPKPFPNCLHGAAHKPPMPTCKNEAIEHYEKGVQYEN